MRGLRAGVRATVGGKRMGDAALWMAYASAAVPTCSLVWFTCRPTCVSPGIAASVRRAGGRAHAAEHGGRRVLTWLPRSRAVRRGGGGGGGGGVARLGEQSGNVDAAVDKHVAEGVRDDGECDGGDEVGASVPLRAAAARNLSV